TVAKLAGMTRNEVMPPLPRTIALVTDRFVFLSLSILGKILYFCFLAAIWMGVSRLFFLAGLSLWNRRSELRSQELPPKKDPFHVSVIIPAYNEESVITNPVHGILASSYSDLDVIGIDDGSKD